MDILFVHRNFPAQFQHLAAHLADDARFRVFAMGSKHARPLRGIDLSTYRVSERAVGGVHPFARRFELESRRAEQVLYAATHLKRSGVTPEVVFFHPGWGEHLALRDVFSSARFVSYCEFYYRVTGADIGFDLGISPPRGRRIGAVAREKRRYLTRTDRQRCSGFPDSVATKPISE